MNRKVKIGDVFAFDINMNNKYGIIQVINEGNTGINIWVFYKTIHESNFIETHESEMLIEYIDLITQTTKYLNQIIDFNKLRQW